MRAIKIVSMASISIFFLGRLAWPEAGGQQSEWQWVDCCMPVTQEVGAPEKPRGSMPGMMKQSGTLQEMMRRWQVMIRAPIFLDSPCAIYGQGDALGLSKEQEENLQEIESEARKKALAVLTAEQRKKLGEIPDKPVAMMQMCRRMCAKMMPMARGMRDDEGMGAPMMMCPMMKMMRRGSAPEGPGSKSGG